MAMSYDDWVRMDKIVEGIHSRITFEIDRLERKLNIDDDERFDEENGTDEEERKKNIRRLEEIKGNISEIDKNKDVGDIIVK